MTKIPALIVNQWLRPEWDETVFEPAPPRGQPEPYFYVFSVSAFLLKRLTGIYRRDPTKPPAEDMGIQRRHMSNRSEEILRYMLKGFPLSRIDERKLVDPMEANSLRMPGWLPTAIIVNILTEKDRRGVKNRQVAPDELVVVHHPNKGPFTQIELPDKINDRAWQPVIHPIEVIDGQHRLWALERPEEPDQQWSPEFEEKIGQLQVPVVAFHGLDRTWQAYLFYTINQLPKKIDTSQVFDLYPLLRTEEWLLRFEGPKIYRQTRAQDLTTLLWGHPESPWKGRILRLGGREKGSVTQASFINSLMASFIKRWYGGPSNPIGGLFGTPSSSHEPTLEWSREQQAAFLIMVWQVLRNSIVESSAPWALHLLRRCMGNADLRPKATRSTKETQCREQLFSGPETLLATDQGARAYLNTINDFLWLAHEGALNFNRQVINLNEWTWSRKSRHDDNEAVSDALSKLQREMPTVIQFVQAITTPLATFDWRLSSSVPTSDAMYSRQASFRGGSGYRELRRNILLHLRDHAPSPISAMVPAVMDALRFETEEDS